MLKLLPMLAATLVVAATPAAAGSDRDSYARAVDIVETSLAAHGGTASFEEAGGVIEAHGTFDLTTRLQGRSPFRAEPTPIEERISVDLAGDRLAYDLAWSNYQFSRQELREVYDADGRVLFIDKRAKNGGWPPFQTTPDARQRYLRFLPNFFLADALAARKTLRALGRERYDGRAVDVVGYVTAAGDHMTLFIDRKDHLLRGAAHIYDMELLGDTEIRWTWSDFEAQSGLVTPRRLQAHLDGKLLKDIELSVRLGGVSDQAFAPPEGVEVGEPPAPEDLKSYDDFILYSERPGEAREISPGVYLAPNVRPGFHMFFVAFKNFVLAVDAPTGWYEVQQIPPFDFVRDNSTSNLGEKYIRIIKQTIPDKPIRYVALTHHHSDHIGGVRPFIAEGATILAGEAAAFAARNAAARQFTLGRDRLSEVDAEPEIEIVDGERIITDGDMEVRLIELPDGNPKADGFVVVYLPKQKIMYFTSFIYPLPEGAFPAPESIPLSLWFVRWLDQSGLDVERLYNVHGMARVEDWQLQRFREMLASGEYEIAGEESD